MRQGELELFSTQELIDELMGRTTFQGVVLHSEDEVRNRQWHGDRIFKVRFNENLASEEVSRLLGVVAAHLEFHNEE